MTEEQRPADSRQTIARRDKTDYIIHKVIQALDVLEQFHDDVDELSVAQLSNRLGMSESSLALMLATLKTRNYVEQDNGSKKFRLGFKTLELAQAVLRQTDLYRISHPVLSSLAAECGENSSVAVLRKSHVIELDAVLADHPVQVVRRVGVHLPVHCTAAGKMLIASLGEEALELLLGAVELERYTGNTVTRLAGLKTQLRRIAKQGYAVDDGELDRDVRAVAAAIRDYAGKVVGAAVITGPSCRVSRERIELELVALAKKGAREISARLGYHEALPQPPVPGAAAGAFPDSPPSPKCVVPRVKKLAGKRAA